MARTPSAVVNAIALYMHVSVAGFMLTTCRGGIGRPLSADHKSKSSPSAPRRSRLTCATRTATTDQPGAARQIERRRLIRCARRRRIRRCRSLPRHPCPPRRDKSGSGTAHGPAVPTHGARTLIPARRPAPLRPLLPRPRRRSLRGAAACTRTQPCCRRPASHAAHRSRRRAARDPRSARS